MLSTSNLYVRVVGIDREIIPEATVTLTTQNPKRVSIKLKWDKATGLYIGPAKERGVYNLKVACKGCESQNRSIKLPHPATPEEFIMAKEGMPYYYRGKVKTPFKPQADLIGITHNSEAKEAEGLIRNLAKKNRLVEVKVSEQIKQNGVSIYRYSKKSSKADRQKTLETLLREEAVALAGPILELFKERAVYLTPQILVKFRADVTPQQAEKYAKEYGFKLGRLLRYAGNSYLCTASAKADYSLLELANKLAELKEVEYAEPNTVTTSMLFSVIPQDFLLAQQWHVPLINLPQAWQVLRNQNGAILPGAPGDLTYGDENLVIAIADTGLQSNTVGVVTTASHPDFTGNVSSGQPKVAAFYDFANMANNNDVITSDHGMGVAGVVSARADNPSTVLGEFEGLAGAAGNCQVLGIRVPFGQTNVRWADMLVWMAGLAPGWTADGVNYPLGTVFPAQLVTGAAIHTNSTRIPDVGLLDDTLDFVASYARDGRGMVSFLAAGNTAANISNPSNNTIADHDKILTIAASINTDVRSGYSCFDPLIDICAPSNGDGAQTAAGAPGKVTADTIGGGNLAGQTGGPNNYRTNFGGTSSATPLAAGVGALVLSIRPELNWVQVREILRNTAVKIDAGNVDPVGQWTTDGLGNPVFSQWYGFGRVDAEAAVIAARDFDLGADVVIRDNLADTGAVPSGGWHANSPDIWVRRTNDPIPVLAYGANPPHENAIRGQDNYVFLRVRNVGTVATNEVYLRAVICHYPGFEFRYPQEWQPSIPPSSNPPVPFAPGSYLIGEELIDNLLPGADTIVKMTWDQTLIPPSSVTIGAITTNWHPCILAEVSPHDGPAPAGATFDVKRYNDLAHKNITIEDSAFSNGFSSYAMVAGTSAAIGVRSMVVDRSRLTPKTRVYVYCEDRRLMKTWLSMAEKRTIAPAKELPWRKEQRERKAELKPLLKSNASFTLIQPTQIALNNIDGSRTIIEAAKNTRIWLDTGNTRQLTPSVSIGKFQGQEVLLFDGDGSDSIELPLPLAGGEFCAMVLGLEREEDGAFGSLLATQRRNDGSYSAGYEVRG